MATTRMVKKLHLTDGGMPSGFNQCSEDPQLYFSCLSSECGTRCFLIHNSMGLELIFFHTLND